MSEVIVPEEFAKVIKDFVIDIRNTFPEYDALINKWWKKPEHFLSIENEEERMIAMEKSEKDSTRFLFNYCKKKLPLCFFDILYQSEEIFKEGSEVDTEFLPHIYFKDLWQFDISQKTRDTIWKYIQLITFSIIGTLDNKNAFGDTANLFESINKDDFKTKLEETLSNIQQLFESSGKSSDKSNTGESPSTEGFSSNLNTEDIPKANDIHEHITGMLGGKLGKLAQEIAEETAQSINMDMDNVTDMKDVLNNLIKNPTKLMGLVKNVGDKLDSKIKSGDIKESELMAEASDIMNKMKNMQGMGDIQSMLSKMGLGGMAGMNGKVDTNAMEAKLNRNMKMAQTKERMIAKVEASRLAKEMAANANKETNVTLQPAISEEEIIKIFSSGEKAEKTPKCANPTKSSNPTPESKKNGKKKGKK